MNDIKVNGTQIFMGIEIPVIEGGFGENCRVVSAKTISQIHDTNLKEINQSINRLIKKNRIKESVEYIDMFSSEILKVTAGDLGLITSNGQKQCFILSERGYSKLIKYMDDDKSWDIMDNFIDEYFDMRQIINSSEQEKAECLLAIYNGGQNAVVASKRLSELEVKEATAPLLPKAAFHDAVSVSENSIPFGKFAGTFQNKVKNFGRNKIMEWCRKQGYLCSSYDLKNKPSQQMIESGYMEYEENPYDQNGRKYVTYKPLLTGRGQIWLTKKLTEYLNDIKRL